MVFTCVTDTGRLVWDIRNTAVSFHSPTQLNGPAVQDDIFTIILHNITGDSGNVYHSTATAAHVPVSYNGSTVECRGQNFADRQQRSIEIGINYVC